MPEIIHNKLVRDKIPELIKSTGRKVKIRTIFDDEEFLFFLSKKLIEESTEFSTNYAIEELADILEIVQTILDIKGETFSSLDLLRKEKKNKRGGFQSRTILLSSTE